VAASTSATAEPSEGTPEPTTASPRVTGEFATAAGTVYANCSGGRPVLAGVPTAGWWVHESNEAGEVEFESASQKLQVYVTCTGTTPQFSVEGPRADDGGREDATTPAPSSSSSPASPSPDDHSGRDGSGSDDSGGDDSSGRGGGGHGSDDSGGDDSSGHGSDD